ncbi:monovalent cation/H+ antiporter complex subunit F [Aquibacillus rhizosphaerae]|uniref:Monovalent cation/H+ antiporter complex subunit F n=1 Tax=Aquibacillus rhizosphaerae TaxID=3051431 RepID=A0ABT7L9B7_9BACI|nr:monovalent cation/H+ antiporter complex subunit F [Aquibacillus sp. LR5S19]MDL4842454.1 monovalent cation/H+ antiporter complex subunit F [Aquibacillus sp. LR5S19]
MLYVILAIILSAILAFYRVFKGPSLPDRLVAMNSIGVMFLLVLVLLSYYFERKIFLDVALVYGISLFINVLIMAKYLKIPWKG